METNDYNYWALVLGIVSISISLIALSISIVMSNKSNDRALTANEIAKKSLDISFFNYYGEILPDIRIKFHAGPKWISEEEIGCEIFLENKSRGKAIIERIETGLVQISKEDESKFPIELLFNGAELLDVEIPAIDHKWVKTQAKNLNISLKKSYILSYNSIAQGQYFKVFFKDMTGKPYSSYLVYNRDLNEFTGDPKELKN